MIIRNNIIYDIPKTKPSFNDKYVSNYKNNNSNNNSQRDLEIKRYNEINLKWICVNGYYHLLKDKYKRNGIVWLHLKENLVSSTDCRDIIRCLGQIDTELVKIIYQVNAVMFDRSCHTIDASSEIGNLELVQYFFEKSNSREDIVAYTPAGMHLAAINGHIKVVEFLFSNRSRLAGMTSSPMTTATVAARGHIDVLRFLYMNGIAKPTSNELISASANGHIDIVRFMISLNYNEINSSTSQALELSASNGKLEVLKYLHSIGTKLTSKRVIAEAAERGFFEVITFLDLHYPQCVTTVDAIDRAASNGNILIVKYLSQCRTEGFSSKAIDNAAVNGHYDIVRYLLQRRPNCHTSAALLGATKNGHIGVLKLLVDVGHIPLNDIIKQLINTASEHGHIDILEYFLARGDINSEEIPKEWISYSMRLAAVNGRINVVKFFIDNRPDCIPTISRIVEASARANQLEIAEYALNYMPLSHEDSKLQFFEDLRLFIAKKNANNSSGSGSGSSNNNTNGNS